jgi:hypothetical protein
MLSHFCSRGLGEMRSAPDEDLCNQVFRTKIEESIEMAYVITPAPVRVGTKKQSLSLSGYIFRIVGQRYLQVTVGFDI